MVTVMVVAEQVGVRMMKEYFEIWSIKSNTLIWIKEGMKLFGDKGYQAAKNELKVILLEIGYIDMLSW